MVKKSFSVLGKQQDTQIMKFNSHPYTLSLQYPSYRIFFITDRTSSMLGTPQQDKLYEHLHVFNACEQLALWW